MLAPQTEPDTGALAWAATRVRLVATGGRADLIKVSGDARELGREIVQIAAVGDGAAAGGAANARLNSIPITVVNT